MAQVVGDRLVGHDYPGVRGSGFVQYELDELEVGARAATQLDDPEQAWWETIGREILREEMHREERGDHGSCT